MADLTINKAMARALKGMSRNLQKQFKKQSPFYEFISLTPEARMAKRTLEMVERLVPDKRRLKKQDREAIKWLKEKMEEEQPPPQKIESKGYRLPFYYREPEE